jgi:hypothetical protein
MTRSTGMAAAAADVAAASLGRAQMQSAGDLVIRRSLDRADWDALLRRAAGPHITQSWAYGEGKRASAGWSVSRLVFERSGKALALCQVLERRVLGVPVLHRVNRGPILIDHAGQAAGDVLRALRRRWRHFRNGVLLIAPALEGTPECRRLMTEAGFRLRSDEGWQSSLIDLSRDEAALRKALTSAWRNHLKVSERSGMTVHVSSSPQALDWMLARHAENMRAKGFVGPGVAFVRAAFAAAPGDFLVFQALHAGDPVAGALVVTFGQHAEYYLAWYGEAARKLSAGNFLVWNAALEMRRRGCRAFDLGGYGTREKYGKFKEGMRGAEYRLAGEWIAF